MGILSIIPGVSPLEDSLGFRSPNSTAPAKKMAGEDRQQYKDIATQAGTSLGTDYTAPTSGPLNTAGVEYSAGSGTGGQQLAQAPYAQVVGAGPAAQMSAAQMAGSQLNAQQAEQSRAGQLALAAQLQGTMSGTGPSVAQEQLRQTTGANISNAASMAQSAHGAGRMAALRGAAFNQAGIQQNAASQAAGLRAQEINQAAGQLGSLTGQIRAGDTDIASQNAQLAQNAQAQNAGYQQAANLSNAQLQQGQQQFQAGQSNQMGQFNSQLGAQTSQFNAGQGNSLGQFNAQSAQQNNQFNAGASNQTGQFNASQLNAGTLANLQAQLQTNGLNVQQAQSLISSLLNANQGVTGIDSTLYAGQAAYDANKRQMTGQALNAAGGAMTGTGGIPK
jgi:hypothetical protein